VFSASLCILAWPAMVLAGAKPSTPAPATATADARVVTMTYLKSAPGK
jgi:hypothetical protein